MDTAADLFAALQGSVATVGQSWIVNIQNTTSYPQTIAGVSNVTVSGVTVINPGQTVPFLITYSASTPAFTIVGLATTATPAVFPRNAIDGGDFTTNPWQRGTSFTGITNSVVYTADRWFAVGASTSSISVSQQAQTDVPGFGDSLRWGRANTDTAVINLGQVLETLDCIRFQGQEVCLSFWAKAGAQFSGGTLTVQVVYSTTAGNDSACAPGGEQH